MWRVPNSFADELDLQEFGYHRLNGTFCILKTNSKLILVTVEIPSEKDADGNIRKVVCRTYQMSNPDRVRQNPSPHYKVNISCDYNLNKNSMLF